MCVTHAIAVATFVPALADFAVFLRTEIAFGVRKTLIDTHRQIDL